MQRLTRWGNSTGLRIGAEVMAASGLKIGDYVHIRLLDSGEIRIKAASVSAQKRAADTDLVTSATTTSIERSMKW